jgi:hypothetical protein
MFLQVLNSPIGLEATPGQAQKLNHFCNLAFHRMMGICWWSHHSPVHSSVCIKFVKHMFKQRLCKNQSLTANKFGLEVSTDTTHGKTLIIERETKSLASL